MTVFLPLCEIQQQRRRSHARGWGWAVANIWSGRRGRSGNRRLPKCSSLRLVNVFPLPFTPPPPKLPHQSYRCHWRHATSQMRVENEQRYTTGPVAYIQRMNLPVSRCCAAVRLLSICYWFFSMRRLRLPATHLAFQTGAVQKARISFDCLSMFVLQHRDVRFLCLDHYLVQTA